MAKSKKKKKKVVEPKFDWFGKIKEFQTYLIVAVSIVSSLIFFYGFVKLDTTEFKRTDITVVNAQGLLFIEWDLADLPDTHTTVIYYLDGVQFANEVYPDGLREVRGVNSRYISSHVLPPYVYSIPGRHDFKAVVSFHGWSTLFAHETVTFSTTIEVEDVQDENQSNYIDGGGGINRYSVVFSASENVI